MIHCVTCNCITYNNRARLHKGHDMRDIGSAGYKILHNSKGGTFNHYMDGEFVISLNGRSPEELLEIKELVDQLT